MIGLVLGFAGVLADDAGWKGAPTMTVPPLSRAVGTRRSVSPMESRFRMRLVLGQKLAELPSPTDVLRLRVEGFGPPRTLRAGVSFSW